MIDSRPVRKTFPLNIFLENRIVTVVGGGRVGLRKVELLLDSGANIRLVCPDCVPELTALAEAGRIEHRAKKFSPEDLDQATLSIACTDDKHVNRAILQESRSQKIPCCCSDGNWADGDFVTPAVIRSGDLLLAVSTSGRSCRQARLIKENLRRHLDALEGADLLIMGTSHAFLPADRRGPFHLPLPVRTEIGKMVRQIWGIHEFMIFNTCNRVEVIAVVSKEVATADILRRLLHFDQLAEGEYYTHSGFDAFAHFCAVAAGMKSQTPGEFHIVAQLKEAMEEAKEMGWAGPVIHDLHDTVLRVSKEIRHACEPVLVVSEIEDVALRYLDAEGRGFTPHGRALVIGTGVVGTGIIKGLLHRGFHCSWVYHKRIPTLSEAESKQVELIPLSAIPDALPETDVVFSAVPVSEPLITKEHGKQLNPNGALLIDLGMPHNIDPTLDIADTMVVGLDELKNWFRTQSGSLERAEDLCASVIESSRSDYIRLRDSLRGELTKNLT